MAELWVLRCDCLTDEGKPYKVSENCAECAGERAAAHLALGHNPRLFPPAPVVEVLKP